MSDWFQFRRHWFLILANGFWLFSLLFLAVVSHNRDGQASYLVQDVEQLRSFPPRIVFLSRCFYFDNFELMSKTPDNQSELAFYDRIRLYAARFMGNWNDADDIVQETTLRYYQTRRKVPVGLVCAWLYRTARNMMIDLIKRRTYRRRSLQETVPDYYCDLADRNVQREEAFQQFEEVLRIIEQFPAREREIFRLKIQEQLKSKEIAFVVDLTPDNVRQIFCTIVKKLRDEMS